MLLDVVVVDVELGGGVGGPGGLQRRSDVASAEGVVEDVAAPGTVIVEGLCSLQSVSSPVFVNAYSHRLQRPRRLYDTVRMDFNFHENIVTYNCEQT